MNYKFTAEVKEVVGFENPLIIADMALNGETYKTNAWLDIRWPEENNPESFRELLYKVTDKMFPKKSAPVKPTEDDGRKPSSPKRRKTDD